MISKYRQLIVAAAGLVVASFGLSLRFAINHVSSYDALALIGSFGRERAGNWGSPSVQSAHQVLSTVFMSVFFAGLALMFAATLAWLFTSERKETNAA
jgi:hypothetical protein